ncbi:MULTISPECIES: formyltransferase family protein [unclassified Oscillibacter]|uniref:formyltransferase family protein n=1 Tax=unclassified Oscillibacter TaxID=2629304 RepID=UPI0025D271BF|nr:MULTISPECIES: formyltransferase family protein [unclassified Oscillibacter]
MKMIFMGRKQSGAEMLSWTISQGVEIVGVVTDAHIPSSPTMAVAKKHDLRLMSMEEAEEEMGRDENFADVVVSYLFWRKLKHPLIDVPQYGCINFHPAILPDYRGLAGYNVAILNKLPEWGATAHYVDASIDTGSIIRVYRFHFDYRFETAFSLEKKTLLLQQDLYRSVVADVIEKGRLEAQRQSRESGLYINKFQMLEMMRVLPGDDVDTKIQAFWFPPYSGAYVEIGGKQYTLVNDFILNGLAGETQTFQK